MLIGGVGKLGAGLIGKLATREATNVVAKELAATGATSIQQVATKDLMMTHGQTLSNRAMGHLTQDIAKNGIQQPLNYVEHNGTKYLVDGHHRLMAARRLGMDAVPAQQVSLPFRGYRTAADLLTGP